MTWCGDCRDEPSIVRIKTCPSCGHQIKNQEKTGIHNLPGLPAGVKFDPSDQELLEHLEAKARSDSQKIHPLIDEFIPTLEGEDGICYTHPERLPGVSKDGLVRHFFHRPSKAYTTGTRKRRKVLTNSTEGNETRWHKTGKTRPIFLTTPTPTPTTTNNSINNKVKGYKKILVLYTNYGKQKKPEKTNWVMHQYHLGNNEDEKEGELVVSKVFYQTQPRQCGSYAKDEISIMGPKSKGSRGGNGAINNQISQFHDCDGGVDYYSTSNPTSLISFEICDRDRTSSRVVIPKF